MMGLETENLRQCLCLEMERISMRLCLVLRGWKKTFIYILEVVTRKLTEKTGSIGPIYRDRTRD